MLDLLAADCARRQDVDEAIRLTQRAIDAEPNDEQRYVQFARLLVSQGRAGRRWRRCASPARCWAG
ncbi:MAG: hypothetical protein ACLP8S_29760 [Solirubrobacteraceae bacterium]